VTEASLKLKRETVAQCGDIERMLKDIAAKRAPLWGGRCIGEIGYINLSVRLNLMDPESMENAERLVGQFAREAFSWAYFIVGRDWTVEYRCAKCGHTLENHEDMGWTCDCACPWKE
jgi:hypothetical protein